VTLIGAGGDVTGKLAMGHEGDGVRSRRGRVRCLQAPAAFHWSSSGTTLLVMDSRVHSPTPRGGLRIDPAVEIAAVRLAEATDAEAIILFGSRARGDNDDESDWDLCVILPDNVEWGRFTPITLWSLVSDLGISIQVVEASFEP
jgi:predicted nucleotidyltransferase